MWIFRSPRSCLGNSRGLNGIEQGSCIPHYKLKIVTPTMSPDLYIPNKPIVTSKLNVTAIGATTPAIFTMAPALSSALSVELSSTPLPPFFFSAIASLREE